MKIKDFNPVVDKKILVLIAGLMWCGVGVMLMNFALTWLAHYHGNPLFYLAGFISAIVIHRYGFMKIADKNINRLLPLTEKKCIFSFMTWKSYIIVVIMVSMGIALRHSSIPKNNLSILYNGIGLSLILSGLHYFRFFLKLLHSNTPVIPNHQ